jgi:hypothetical protein
MRMHGKLSSRRFLAFSAILNDDWSAIKFVSINQIKCFNRNVLILKENKAKIVKYDKGKGLIRMVQTSKAPYSG